MGALSTSFDDGSVTGKRHRSSKYPCRPSSRTTQRRFFSTSTPLH